MSKEKSFINEIVKLMKEGLEKPKPQMIDGKKMMIITGDFVTLDIEPNHGDRAFCINREEGDPIYYVEITRLEI